MSKKYDPALFEGIADAIKKSERPVIVFKLEPICWDVNEHHVMSQLDYRKYRETDLYMDLMDLYQSREYPLLTTEEQFEFDATRIPSKRIIAETIVKSLNDACDLDWSVIYFDAYAFDSEGNPIEELNFTWDSNIFEEE